MLSTLLSTFIHTQNVDNFAGYSQDIPLFFSSNFSLSTAFFYNCGVFVDNFILLHLYFPCFSFLYNISSLYKCLVPLYVDYSPDFFVKAIKNVHNFLIYKNFSLLKNTIYYNIYKDIYVRLWKYQFYRWYFHKRTCRQRTALL